RGDNPRNPHQHDGVEIGRAADLVDDDPHATPMVSAKATSASSKHLSGAFTMPAPTWPTPGSRCAIPVLMVGASPVSTTRRISMPVGTPAKSIAGMVHAGLGPTAISAIERVNTAASDARPAPIYPTTAGAAAIAKPPSPTVSTMAESPISGFASFSLKPGK